MQKVVKFLESYVQWIALSLGVAWVLWVGYAYWVQKPVFKEIAGKQYGPAEVDEFITRQGGPIDVLANSLKTDAKVPKDVEKYFPEVPQYVQKMRDEMGMKDVVVATLQPFSPASGGKIEANTPKPENADKIAETPVIAGVATTLGTLPGLSMAYVPDSKAVINPKDLTQKLFQPTVPVPPAADPNNPTAPLPTAPLPIVMTQKEVSWITYSANVSMKALGEAFTKAKIPEAAAITQFLKTQLIREEKLADGTWTNQTRINDLPITTKLAWPPKPETAEEGIYLGWSSTNVADIVEPPFYEVLRGQLWRTVSMPDPNAPALVVAAEFDPSKVLPADISKLTPEQKKLWIEYQVQLKKDEEAKRKEEAAQRKGRQRPNTPGGERGRGGLPSGAPPTPTDQRIGGADRQPPNNYGRGRRGFNPRGPGRTDGTQGNQPNYATPGNPAASATLPAGTFRPADPAAVDVEVWAHDDTTIPGHVYRYKIEVYFKNPLFGTTGMAKNANDETVFALKAETEWSKEVESPKKHYFFAASGGEALGGNTPKMKFEYFWWEEGDWKTKTLTLQPGDAVGSTPWTLVDIRPTTGTENHALLVNQMGAVQSRTQKTDLASEDYKKIKALVKPATAAAGATGTGS